MNVYTTEFQKYVHFYRTFNTFNFEYTLQRTL